MTAAINYGLIAQAVEHYTTTCGYARVEVPWLVEPRISALTAPKRRTGFLTRDFGELVGSAEQSFLAMMDAGALPEGRYVATTPCFRDEKVLDALHQRAFLKTELIDTRSVCFEHPQESLTDMIVDAAHFFRDVARIDVTFVRCGEDAGGDLVDRVHGIELGSYGIRERGPLRWIYGTGCAEPRTSIVRHMRTARDAADRA